MEHDLAKQVEASPHSLRLRRAVCAKRLINNCEQFDTHFQPAYVNKAMLLSTQASPEYRRSHPNMANGSFSAKGCEVQLWTRSLCAVVLSKPTAAS